MNRSINRNNINRLRRQLENSKNINIIKTPKRIVKKPVKKLVKKPVAISTTRNNRTILSKSSKNNTLSTTRNNRTILSKSSKNNTLSTTRNTRTILSKSSENNTFWNIFYILLLIATLFLIGLLLYNLYVNYFNKSQPVPEIIIEDTIKKDKVKEDTIKEDPKGVIIDQDNAPISVEKGGDISENKYLSVYDNNNFIFKNISPLYEYGQYASYPSEFKGKIDIDFNGYSRYNNYAPRYDSQSDDGVTKIYYKNMINSERFKINNYIRNQNDYIRNINKRVRQINTSRMNTPTYSRDTNVLQEVRNYERRLANQVHKEQKNQPYLSDQEGYY